MLSLQIWLFVPVVDICDCIYFWFTMAKLKPLSKKVSFLFKTFIFLVNRCWALKLSLDHGCSVILRKQLLFWLIRFTTQAPSQTLQFPHE